MENILKEIHVTPIRTKTTLVSESEFMVALVVDRIMQDFTFHQLLQY